MFLDLPAGRYFLIEGRTSQAFAHFLEQRASDDEQAVLLDQQLICPASGLANANLPLPQAVAASLIDQPLPDAPWLDTLRAIAAQRRARFDIRRHPVFEITQRIGERLGKYSPEGRQETYVRVAAAFQRARRYAPATDRCLERGIAMRRILARAGCDARLVFGVTLPFAAHCWVQTGKAVLTDPLDVVLRYKPILAV
ncbi:lasso peptide biosynthesis B2 protein [Sphingopyxis sp. 550A]